MATKQLSSIDQRCITQALSVLGDKWTPLLVRELTRCPQNFSDLEKALIGISPRTLSQRLNMLVVEKIINKDMYCMHPPRYNYSLTQKGQDLQDILKDMAIWSEKYQ